MLVENSELIQAGQYINPNSSSSEIARILGRSMHWRVIFDGTIVDNYEKPICEDMDDLAARFLRLGWIQDGAVAGVMWHRTAFARNGGEQGYSLAAEIVRGIAV